jgi:hypothetical protein
MSNPTHEEAKWLIAHAKENNKIEWLAGWDSGRNYGKLCAEERIIKLLEIGGPIEQIICDYWGNPKFDKDDALVLIERAIKGENK